MERISAKKIAVRVSKLLQTQNPNYDYLRDVFRFVRQELNIKVTTTPKKLPYVPTKNEIKQFYKAVWESKDTKHLLIIKTLLLTGVRVSELIVIKLRDIDISSCTINIIEGKGKKDRVVPFSSAFKETLALHISRRHREVYITT